MREQIIEHGRSSVEIGYEQTMIRASNLELRNNSDYLVVDRQYRSGA